MIKNTIAEIFSKQKKFNDLFYDDSLDQCQKEEITKSLSLALHSEVSSMITGINFKDHRADKNPVDVQRIIYESVDIFRYLIAILNLWEVNPDDFEHAFDDKDLFLHMRHEISTNTWRGQPVLIVDVDDVICHFRDGFMRWLHEEYDITVRDDCTEYYTTSAVKDAGFNPESVFVEFINNRKLLDLQADTGIIDVLNELHSTGYWIHILTARPTKDLTCFYDTHRWLEACGLDYDRISFSPEKYRWLTQSEYYDSGKVVCAIDDSPKHVAEYAKHGVRTLCPRKIYNTEVELLENVFIYDSEKDIFQLIEHLNYR